MALYALIPFHDFLRVDLQLLVGIHHYAEQTGICLKRYKENNTLVNSITNHFDCISP